MKKIAAAMVDGQQGSPFKSNLTQSVLQLISSKYPWIADKVTGVDWIDRYFSNKLDFGVGIISIDGGPVALEAPVVYSSGDILPIPGMYSAADKLWFPFDEKFFKTITSMSSSSIEKSAFGENINGDNESPDVRHTINENNIATQNKNLFVVDGESRTPSLRSYASLSTLSEIVRDVAGQTPRSYLKRVIKYAANNDALLKFLPSLVSAYNINRLNKSASAYSFTKKASGSLKRARLTKIARKNAAVVPNPQINGTQFGVFPKKFLKLANANVRTIKANIKKYAESGLFNDEQYKIIEDEHSAISDIEHLIDGMEIAHPSQIAQRVYNSLTAGKLTAYAIKAGDETKIHNRGIIPALPISILCKRERIEPYLRRFDAVAEDANEVRIASGNNAFSVQLRDTVESAEKGGSSILPPTRYGVASHIVLKKNQRFSQYNEPIHEAYGKEDGIFLFHETGSASARLVAKRLFSTKLTATSFKKSIVEHYKYIFSDEARDRSFSNSLQDERLAMTSQPVYLFDGHRVYVTTAAIYIARDALLRSKNSDKYSGMYDDEFINTLQKTKLVFKETNLGNGYIKQALILANKQFDDVEYMAIIANKETGSINKVKFALSATTSASTSSPNLYILNDLLYKKLYTTEVLNASDSPWGIWISIERDVDDKTTSEFSLFLQSIVKTTPFIKSRASADAPLQAAALVKGVVRDLLDIISREGYFDVERYLSRTTGPSLVITRIGKDKAYDKDELELLYMTSDANENVIGDLLRIESGFLPTILYTIGMSTEQVNKVVKRAASSTEQITYALTPTQAAQSQGVITPTPPTSKEQLGTDVMQLFSYVKQQVEDLRNSTKNQNDILKEQLELAIKKTALEKDKEMSSLEKDIESVNTRLDDISKMLETTVDSIKQLTESTKNNEQPGAEQQSSGGSQDQPTIDQNTAQMLAQAAADPANAQQFGVDTQTASMIQAALSGDANAAQQLGLTTADINLIVQAAQATPVQGQPTPPQIGMEQQPGQAPGAAAGAPAQGGQDLTSVANTYVQALLDPNFAQQNGIGQDQLQYVQQILSDPNSAINAGEDPNLVQALVAAYNSAMQAGAMTAAQQLPGQPQPIGAEAGISPQQQDVVDAASVLKDMIPKVRAAGVVNRHAGAFRDMLNTLGELLFSLEFQSEKYKDELGDEAYSTLLSKVNALYLDFGDTLLDLFMLQ